MARTIGIIALVLCAITILAIVGVVVYVAILPYRVDREIAAIKARGEPVSTADLAGKPVPDEKNAAILYEKAFKLISDPKAQESVGRLTDFLDRKKREADPKLWDDARQTVERYAPAVMPILREAVSRPECRFPIKWAECPMETLFPHLKRLSDLSNLVLADALLRARDRDADGAVDDAILVLRMRESLGNEPNLIAWLAARGMVRRACSATIGMMRYVRLNDVQVAQLSDALSRMNMNSGFKEGFQGERAIGIEMFRYVTTKGFEGTPEGDSRPPRIRIPRILISADELIYLDRLALCVDAGSMTYREAKAKLGDKLTGDVPRYAFFSNLLTPVYGNVLANRDEGVAHLGAARICLGLHAYRNRFGSYPRSLDELRGRLKWRVPKDPFSGRDFVYKRRGKGFILYSIGQDLKDDGGTPIDPKARGAKEDKGDIVWQMTT